MSSIRDVAISLTNPAAFTLLLLVVAGLVTLAGRWRSGAAMVVLASAWSVIWSIPLASDALRGVLERQHPILDEATLPRADAIVVLGGGGGGYRWLRREDVSANELLSSRAAAGARAWHAGRAPLVVLSGGGVGDDTEARAMASAVTRLGVPGSALVLEERSHSTRENARHTAALASRLGIDSVLLVTSSLHMPRATVEFRNARFVVHAVPVPEHAKRTSFIQRWRPSRTALRRSSRAFKELAALVEAQFQAARTADS